MLRALVVIDYQNDFLSEGALAVPSGNEVGPVIHSMASDFDLILASLDWHPFNHVSFETFRPADERECEISAAIEKWPVHCVGFTGGAMPGVDLDVRGVQRFFPKACDRLTEELSCVAKGAESECARFLRSAQVDEVHLVGLALDYCVKDSALGLVEVGFSTHVHLRGTRSLSPNPENSIEHMVSAGVRIHE